jgi:hypothetical protein
MGTFVREHQENRATIGDKKNCPTVLLKIQWQGNLQLLVSSEKR